MSAGQDGWHDWAQALPYSERVHATADGSAKLPNLLIVGVAKAATTSLFRYLAQHPDIFPAELKELRYFTPLRYGEPLAPIESYLTHFRNWTMERYAVEATPGYFPGGLTIAKGIDSTLDQARVLLSFRDPADRCWSYFRFMKSRVRVPKDMDFESYLDRCMELHRQGVDGTRAHQPFWGLGSGCYATWLPSWAGVFGNRLRVVFFDDIIEKPDVVVTGICQWLDLNTAPVAQFDFTAENKSEQYRYKSGQVVALRLNRRAERFFTRHRKLKQAMRKLYHVANSQRSMERPSVEARARLEEFYRPHTAALSQQLAELGVTQQPGWLASSSPSDQRPRSRA